MAPHVATALPIGRLRTGYCGRMRLRRITSLFARPRPGVLGSTALPAVALSSTPAYAGDFPDPFVLAVAGTYWAYSTGSAGRNLQVMSSTDLHNWTTPTDPLPVLPSWAAVGSTWAPGVLRQGASFLMYYTVRDAALGRQCISVASSSNPGGPFLERAQGAAGLPVARLDRPQPVHRPAQRAHLSALEERTTTPSVRSRGCGPASSAPTDCR